MCLYTRWGKRKLWWVLRLWLQAGWWGSRSRAEESWRIAVWIAVPDLVLKTSVGTVESSVVAGAQAKTCNAPTVSREDGDVLHREDRSHIVVPNKPQDLIRFCFYYYKTPSINLKIMILALNYWICRISSLKGPSHNPNLLMLNTGKYFH